MGAGLCAVVLLAAAGGAAAKLPPAVAKEMAEAVLAADKALGLESWPVHGVKPCVDQGSPSNLTKKVTVEDTRRCAAAAVERGFPGLGKSYVLAVLMAEVGPMTVVAFGIGDGTGFAARSCDPGKSCPAMRMSPSNKWGKRLLDRQTKACADAATIWLPAGQNVCPTKGL